MRPKGKLERIRPDQLIVWEGLQQREEFLDQQHAASIGRALKDGQTKAIERVKVRRVTDPADLPPKLLEKFPSRTVWNLVTDGVHTVEGYRLSGAARSRGIPCDVLAGTYHDAFLDSCAANAHHLAKHRTQGDKQKAIIALFDHLKARGEKWTQRKMALHCKVDSATVREALKRHRPQETVDEGEAIGNDGRRWKPHARTTKERTARTGDQPPVAETSTGGWREMPIAESLTMSEPMFARLEKKGIRTCGDLYDRMRRHELLGFMGGEYKDVMAQLQAMKDVQEVKAIPWSKQGSMTMEWAKAEGWLGALVRIVDDIPRIYPKECETRGPVIQAMHRCLDTFKTHFDEIKAGLTKSTAK